MASLLYVSATNDRTQVDNNFDDMKSETYQFNNGIADIHAMQIETKDGNTVSVFFNRKTNTLTVDLTYKSGDGSNEIVCMTLDEKNLLDH
jgi:hypothetical protein